MLDRITKTMEEKGITQRELTQKLGIAESAFGGWRRGATSSYRTYLPEIATILGVTTDYLAFGTKTENEEFFRLWEETEPEIQEAVLTILRHNRNKGMKYCRGDVTRK